MFCHFEASLVAPLPAGGLLSLVLCITAGGLGLLIREVLGGLSVWGREGGKIGGMHPMLERSLVTTKRVLRHMADITVRQTVQCLPPSQQPACGTQVQDCNNDPQEEHGGHGGEIRKHDQYRVRVDRLDQTTSENACSCSTGRKLSNTPSHLLLWFVFILKILVKLTWHDEENLEHNWLHIRERERERNTLFQARFYKLYSGECKVQNLELLNTLVILYASAFSWHLWEGLELVRLEAVGGGRDSTPLHIMS